MVDPAQCEREQAFRADVARLVQAMHHYLPADQVSDEVAPLVAPVRHLASLLGAGASSGSSSPFSAPMASIATRSRSTAARIAGSMTGPSPPPLAWGLGHS